MRAATDLGIIVSSLSEGQAESELPRPRHVGVAQVLSRLAEARVVDDGHERAEVVVVEEIEDLARERQTNIARQSDLLLNPEIHLVQWRSVHRVGRGDRSGCDRGRSV